MFVPVIVCVRTCVPDLVCVRVFVFVWAAMCPLVSVREWGSISNPSWLCWAGQEEHRGGD